MYPKTSLILSLALTILTGQLPGQTLYGTSQFSKAEVSSPINKLSKLSKLSELSEQEQTALTAGKVILTGQDGHYVSKILINAPIEKAWKVLTDYRNFPKFLPTVTSVKILESKGNYTVYEQTNVVQILFFSQSSKLTIAATADYPSLITFEMQTGESIKSLNGVWQIEVISPNQVLVTNTVNVEPSPSTPSSLFFSIYSDSLIKTLIALRQEAERRSSY
ncbi:oligoketide cyclase/lipid transport protein [Synechococcus sp. PCC 7502]|uniref:SRPBCC family protein n=1 Tax=Synechococcus sp. PCC 7502 TaxID=1173263 RepID=UPI00029FA3E2|nr:SRPBCC family protein [Synechococcus sp. PCC 7502]AFY72723.1 oligoketide cyclase/lipid transport protein [Synechococcus sp. PCC 7502]